MTGCTKVSAGCKHCYAEGVANRFWASQYPAIPTGGGMHADGERPRQFTDVMTHAGRLLEPLSWRKPARVFVNSMSDLFHEDVPDAFIDQVFHAMQQSERHTFQVLTKRADRMREYVQGMAALTGHERGARVLTSAGWSTLASEVDGDGFPWPLSNVWLGVSVENQYFADERIPLLLETPAAVRFLSCEPLLEGLDISKHYPLTNRLWVIVGGESGPGARPCEIGWIRNIVRQCQGSGVPVFVKQLGAHPLEGWPNGPTPHHRVRFHSKKGGDMAEWPEDLRVREFPLAGEAQARPR